MCLRVHSYITIRTMLLEDIMKKIYLFLAFCLLIAFTIDPTWSQSYEATMDLTVSGSFLDIDLYLQTTSGTSDMLGDATLVITYNSNALSWVGKVSSFDGRWDNNNAPDDYANLTSSNVTDLPARASLDVTKSGEVGVVGLDIPTSSPPDPTNRVGRIRFNIIDATLDAQIAWLTADPRYITIKDYAGNDIKDKFTFTNPTQVPLPIQLASFTASVIRDNDVEVAWKTVSETNDYGFEIYRKRGETSEWEKIAFVEGHGTTLAAQSYTYIDRSLGFGKYFYQIKQVDLDGSSKVFPEVGVTVGLSPGKFILAQNYPNPFNPSTVIEFAVPQDGFATLKVYNTLGQEVAMLFRGEVTAGIHSVEWSPKDLASGVYVYRLEVDNGVNHFIATRRLILMR
jgi:hypothetical protein